MDYSLSTLTILSLLLGLYIAVALMAFGYFISRIRRIITRMANARHAKSRSAHPPKAGQLVAKPRRR